MGPLDRGHFWVRKGVGYYSPECLRVLLEAEQTMQGLQGLLGPQLQRLELRLTLLVLKLLVPPGQMGRLGLLEV